MSKRTTGLGSPVQLLALLLLTFYWNGIWYPCFKKSYLNIMCLNGFNDFSCFYFILVLFFYFCRAKRFVALKVVKSAQHYTETALDEIKLLKCVSILHLMTKNATNFQQVIDGDKTIDEILQGLHWATMLQYSSI